MTLLDIVVVGHRTPRLFRECIASIHEHLADLDYNLITVDNSPDDHVGEHVIPNNGYGQACKYGASLGSAPYLLLLNADTRATAQSNMPHIFELFDSDPRIAIIGPKQLHPEGWLASAGCPPANNGVGYTIRGWKQKDRGQYNDILDCMYVAGSVVFTRREVWDELGGFLETMTYYEETFYCYLARHRGYRCVYTGRSTWIHWWDQSPKPNKDMLSGRPVAKESHKMFVAALLAEGVPAAQIPPFV